MAAAEKTTGQVTAEDRADADAFLTYINATPTPFHLVRETAARLEANGFVRLDESAAWAREKMVLPGGKYWYARNGSTIVAFVVGGKFDATGSGGFKLVGAHTDSPVLKIKPVSKRTAHGYIQCGVETYGGGLWHTWFDRELTLAGRVIVKKEAGGFEAKLVHIKRPLLRVPNLCIHLQSGEERAAMKVNKEVHLEPVLALVAESLNKEGEEEGDARHAPELIRILAEELGCKPSAIQDLELSLCDTQDGRCWGANNEFLSSPRLDNQVHCYSSMAALINYGAKKELVDADVDVSGIALFDHEEVGSQSAVGAGSPIMKEAVGRISSCFIQPADDEVYGTVVAKSFMFSADVAHAIHPNYASKHESSHQPVLNMGTVIKTNSNQRYATNSISGFFCREIARQAAINVQEFVVRQDCPCGTTIGPIISGNTGIRTIDVGVPSLSMHSIRETIGVSDILNSRVLFETFFEKFRELDESFAQDTAICPPCN